MRSQTKEHTEISAADVLNGGEVQLATADLRNEVLQMTECWAPKPDCSGGWRVL
jgi:hypothetical protein